MTTNVTVFPVDGQAVVYFQDGTSVILEPQKEEFFQIVPGGFVTISDAPTDVSVPPHHPLAEFWRKFWQTIRGEIKEEIDENQPQVNPL